MFLLIHSLENLLNPCCSLNLTELAYRMARQ